MVHRMTSTVVEVGV